MVRVIILVVCAAHLNRRVAERPLNSKKFEGCAAQLGTDTPDGWGELRDSATQQPQLVYW